MSIRLKIALITLLAGLASLANVAVAALDYGFVTVSVPARDGAARQAAIKDGISEAAIRLSGSRELDAIGLDALLRTADRYVVGYGYQDVDDQLKLQLTVDWTRLRDAMVQHRLPIWDYARPTVLAWIAVDDGQRQLLSADSEFVEALNSVARKRGVELVWPLMDLQDQMAVSVSDVWAVFDSNLREASRRYEVSTLLVGRVAGRVGRLQGRWDLLDAVRSDYFGTENADLLGSLSEGVELAVDRMGASFAYVPEAQPLQYNLAIRGVEEGAEYARLVNALRELSPLQKVQPTSISDQQLTLSLTSMMDRVALDKLMSRLGLLEPAGVDRARVQWYRPPQTVTGQVE